MLRLLKLLGSWFINLFKKTKPIQETSLNTLTPDQPSITPAQPANKKAMGVAMSLQKLIRKSKGQDPSVHQNVGINYAGTRAANVGEVKDTSKKQNIVAKLVGGASVGKTTLLLKFRSYFTSSPATHSRWASISAPAMQGQWYVTKEFSHRDSNTQEEHVVKMAIWDRPYKFDKEYEGYYVKDVSKECDVYIYFFDLTDPSSLDELIQLHPKKTYDPAFRPGSIVLVGTKADLPRKVAAEQAVDVARKINAAYIIDISAKTGQNVEKTFNLAAEVASYKSPLANEAIEERYAEYLRTARENTEIETHDSGMKCP